MTITLSYAAFALALGIGSITLGYPRRRGHHDAIPSLTRFTYKAMQVGVLLLSGTILGDVGRLFLGTVLG
jgi:hypothetical protein